MATVAITPDQDRVVAEIVIAAPPARVFAALTDQRQLLQWWQDEDGCRTKTWDIDPRLGGQWHFVGSDPTGKLVINGLSCFEMKGEITEFDPPRVLAYTWSANFHRIPWQETWVRWELTPVDGGTRVKVTHGGLQNLSVDRKEYGDGWPEVLNLLRRHCE